MGIFNKIRGGAGSGRGDNPHGTNQDPFVGQGVTWGIHDSGRTWDNNDRARWKQDKNSVTNSKTSRNWNMQDKTTYGNEVPDTTSPWANPNRQTAGGKMLPGLSPFGD